jgi:DNA-binding XRE family transcriptional regulator
MVENELNFNGQKLKDKRESLQKTRTEVAQFLEITPQSYGEMEKSLIKPNSNNLAKLCIYFDCPVQDFFNIPEKFLAKI